MKTKQEIMDLFDKEFPAAPKVIKKRGRPRKFSGTGVKVTRSTYYTPSKFKDFLSRAISQTEERVRGELAGEG